MKAGAIVPMKDMRTLDNSVDNPEHMEVRIFPAEDGNFTLWEDAGDTPTDEDENWAATQLTFTGGTKDQFIIGNAMGNLSVIPEKRSWKLVFTGVENVNTATAPMEKIKQKIQKLCYGRSGSVGCSDIL